MSFQCPICKRSFSHRTAYTQHVQKCIKKVEVEEDDDVEMNIKSNQSSKNSDENDIKVIILIYYVISDYLANYKLYNF